MSSPGGTGVKSGWVNKFKRNVLKVGQGAANKTVDQEFEACKVAYAPLVTQVRELANQVDLFIQSITSLATASQQVTLNMTETFQSSPPTMWTTGVKAHNAIAEKAVVATQTELDNGAGFKVNELLRVFESIEVRMRVREEARSQMDYYRDKYDKLLRNREKQQTEGKPETDKEATKVARNKHKLELTTFAYETLNAELINEMKELHVSQKTDLTEVLAGYLKAEKIFAEALASALGIIQVADLPQTTSRQTAIAREEEEDANDQAAIAAHVSGRQQAPVHGNARQPVTKTPTHSSSNVSQHSPSNVSHSPSNVSQQSHSSNNVSQQSHSPASSPSSVKSTPTSFQTTTTTSTSSSSHSPKATPSSAQPASTVVRTEGAPAAKNSPTSSPGPTAAAAARVAPPPAKSSLKSTPTKSAPPPSYSASRSDPVVKRDQQRTPPPPTKTRNSGGAGGGGGAAQNGPLPGQTIMQVQPGQKLTGTQAMLYWAQKNTQGFEGVNIKNLSKSWKNGLAFCALACSFNPKALNYKAMHKKTPMQRLDVAFAAAEKMGVAMLLDPEDVVQYADKKSITTQLTMYQRTLGNGRA